MTDPVLAKTWNTTLANYKSSTDTTQDNGTTDGTNARKEVLLTIVNGLLSHPGSGWTVTRSSNAVSVADSNLWSVIADLRWNSSITSTRSWIAFQHTALSSHGNVYLLFDLVNVAGYDGSLMEVWLSTDGPFTGGTISTRPSAPNEVQLKDGNTTAGDLYGYWGVGDNTNTEYQYRVNQINSSDGQCSRTHIWINDVCTGYITFERLNNPQGQTYDFLVTWAAGTTSTQVGPDDTKLYNLDQSVKLITDAKTLSLAQYTTPGAELVTAFSTVPVRREDSQVGVWPIGVWGTTSGWQYKWGDLFDCYWASMADEERIEHYPNDAVRNWVSIQGIVIPWGNQPIIQTQ